MQDFLSYICGELNASNGAQLGIISRMLLAHKTVQPTAGCIASQILLLHKTWIHKTWIQKYIAPLAIYSNPPLHV